MKLHDKMPPHSIEAELSVIGGAFRDPRVFDELATIVGPEDFFRAAHATVWAELGAMARAGVPLEPMATLDRLDAAHPGGRDAWARLIDDALDAVPYAVTSPYYAAQVGELASVRRLAEAAGKILETCYGPADRPAAEVVAEAEELVLGASRAAFGREAAQAGEVLLGCLESLSGREAGVASGLPTGFRDFDDVLDGFRPGQLIVLAARPGQGKSSFALDVANNVAFEQRKSVVFSSLEMGRSELGDRLLSSLGRVPGRAIRSGQGLSESMWRSMNRVQEQAGKVRFEVDDAADRSVSELAAICRRRKAKCGLDLLVVDYLQLLKHESAKGSNRQEQVAKASRDLKCLAKSLAIPVLVLSQLNRDVEKRADQRPVLSDLRESGAIEQDADVVLFLYHGSDMGPSDLIIAKNRSGPTGVVQLNYRRDLTTFENWPPIDAVARVAAPY